MLGQTCDICGADEQPGIPFKNVEGDEKRKKNSVII
jgi:hypothetical protein